MAVRARTGSHRLPGLDAVRGVAVAVVVAYHLGAIPGGWIGVDVFFVLSGFLVTSRLLHAADDPARTGWLRGFWGRRARRLVPALAVTVGVVTLLAVVGDWPSSQLDRLGLDGVAALGWWANWRHLAAGDGGYWASDPSPLLHTWSLAIEEQFYVLWPLVVAGCVWAGRQAGWALHRTVGVAAVVGAVASGAWGVVLAHRLDDAALARVYLGSDTRMVAALAGCGLAAVMHRRTLGPAGRRVAALAGAVGALVLVTIALSTHVSDPSWYRFGGHSIAALAAMALVVWSTTWRRVDPATSWLGTRSYAIYLWSWPLQVLLVQARPALSPWLVAAVVVPVTLGLAELSWRFVEQPILRGERWAARPALRRPAFAGGVVAVAAALATATAVSTAPPVHERLETGTANTAPPPTVAAVPATSGSDDPEAREHGPWRVMVTGDSAAFTAGMYAPRAGLDHIVSVDGRGMIGCGVLAGDAWSYQSPDDPEVFRPIDGCAEQRTIEAVGLGGHPDAVVTMLGAWEWGAIRSTDGEVVEARSPAMADLLVAELVARAREADAVGAAYRIVPWLCPGDGSDPVRSSAAHIDFMASVAERAVDEATAQGLQAAVLDTTDATCADADPHGGPTPERRSAMPDGVHVEDAEGGMWLWSMLDGPIHRSMVDEGGG